MNSNRGEQANFELPAQPERPPEADEEGTEQAVEAPPARQEQVGKQAPQPVLPAAPDDIPAADQPDIVSSSQDITASAPSAASTHPQDSDHIEKQWVDKAKAIIAQTQDDPFLQKHEMSRVKADYIQKRFGKQIKTDEARA